MSPALLFQAAAILVISVAGTYYLSGNVEEKDTVIESKPVPVAQKAELSQGSVVSIPRTRGQFFTQGRVNSGSVQFLIDTGASTVALTVADARKAGIDVNRLSFDVPVDTANGRTMAADVTLRDVHIGGVRVTNVRALVLPDGLHISLLGMTFLGELQKVEVLPNQLILRR